MWRAFVGKRRRRFIPIHADTIPIDRECVPLHWESIPHEKKCVPSDSEPIPGHRECVPGGVEPIPHDAECVPREWESDGVDARASVDGRGQPVPTGGEPRGPQPDRTLPEHAVQRRGGAAGNSSGYNYASGRLDHQVYFKCIRVEQHHLQLAVLDRVLKAWLNEAVLVEGLLPQSLRERGVALPEHAWFWDGVEHVDPAKEATAQATRLANHTTTLAAEFARQGRDWEQELRQRAKELVLMDELGLTPAPPAPAGNAPAPKEDDTDGNEDSDPDRSEESTRAQASVA